MEVLSDSTRHIDFGEKLREYGTLPGLDTYLIVAHDDRIVWQWTSDAERLWPADPVLIDGETGIVTVGRVGATLGFDAIYRNVV